MPRIAMDPEEKLLKSFERIDEDWRNRVSAFNVDELKAVLVEITKNESINQETKDLDEDLQRAKAEYDTAVAGYKEATAMNKLKIKFSLRNLKAKGG
jgi:hypothetical protein